MVLGLVGMVLFTTSCLTQPEIKQLKNDNKDEIPKGLKTKTEIVYEIVERSGKYVKLLIFKHISKFNKNGKPDEFASYDRNGTLFRKRIYKYDDNSYQFEENLYNTDGKLTYKNIYKHDGKDKMIESDWYDSSSKLGCKQFFTYDDKGNWIEDAFYYPNGKLYQKFLAKYDDRGNQIEWAMYGADGKEDHKCFYNYDEKDRKITGTVYDADGKLTQRFQYYNGEDNEIEYGKLNYKFFPIYDDKGNKTEEIKYAVAKRFGKVEDIPIEQTTWEYKFYPEAKKNKPR